MQIRNIVATAQTNTRFDLEELALRLPDSRFPPSTGAWLMLRLQPGNQYVAFYRSGKFLIAGVKSNDELSEAVNRVIAELERAGILVEVISIDIHNIVVTDEVRLVQNLDSVARFLNDSSYEPELFPGLVYRAGGSTFLLFNGGKIVSVGNRSIQMAERNLKSFKALLRE